MRTSSAPIPVPPDGAPLEIVVTAAGQAWIGRQEVGVPTGSDPRAAAAAVVSALARQQGRDVHAVLVDAGRGERRRMLFTLHGDVMQATEAMTDGAQEPVPDQDGGLPLPEPPQLVDPAAVPAWPHIDLVLTADGHVIVNDKLIAVPLGVADSRAYAVALAAAELARVGLARPVRASARDPDGTVWPILIHPGGAATEAGPPEIPGTGKRGRRGDAGQSEIRGAGERGRRSDAGRSEIRGTGNRGRRSDARQSENRGTGKRGRGY